MGHSKRGLPILCAIVLLLLQLADAQTERTMRHLCTGTSNGVSKPFATDRWEDLRITYQNCTRVFGNIEITHLDSEDIANRKLDFFDDIEEVKGYVLIYNTDLEQISFKKLKIIWGDQLLGDLTAMQVENNRKLSVISMPNLRSIENGYIFVHSTPNLCHLKNTVHMDEILKFNSSRFVTTRSLKNCARNNISCHSSCNGACWGPEEGDCQRLYRSVCPHDCESKQCYKDSNSNEMRCCHSQCVAGCVGPTSKDCNACSNFKQCNDANTECECVERCTSLRTYNTTTGRIDLNPKGYYTLGNRHCLKKCPANRLVQDDVCVEHCGQGMYYDQNKNDKTCRKCDGHCPKSCKLESRLDSVNIQELHNCTEVEGFIHINAETFRDQHSFTEFIPALQIQDLEILKSVQFISGYLYVADTPLKSLSFLENLEVIEGRYLFSGRLALTISVNENLEYLGLRNMSRVIHGDAIISRNPKLCFIDTLNWPSIVTEPNSTVRVHMNRPEAVCELEGKECHHSCDSALGCWGPGSDDCVKSTATP